jgi:MEMO1 family protein
MRTREMSVSGSFYPAKATEINRMIEQFNTILESHPTLFQRISHLNGNAVIVPHAGWVYSGFTANIAFRLLGAQRFKTVVVIGPSHRIGFEGVSIAQCETYQTPLGEIKTDQTLLQELQENFFLPYFQQAHHEHSTEVQMPFIKYYLDGAQVIELVYAYAKPDLLEPIMTYCLGRPETAIVISTDLSHYYSLSEAKQLDSLCLDAIHDKNSVALHQGCEACGIIGIEAILNVARSKDLHPTLLDYRTSADASGDTSQVVGYASVLFSPPL